MIYNVLRWYHEDLNIPTPVACNMYFLGNKYYRGGESTYFARMKFIVQYVLFHHHKQKLYNVVNNRSHKVVLI